MEWQYKGGVFKVPAIDRWIVVVSGPELIDELRKMPDEMVSFELATGGVRTFSLFISFYEQAHLYSPSPLC